MLVDIEFSMLAHKIKIAKLKYDDIKQQKHKQKKDPDDYDYDYFDSEDEINDQLKQVNLTKGKKGIENKITYELEEGTKEEIEDLDHKILAY